ncbi:unnamed protein product [Wuchereria bancrofti]|uniref:Uncharacterized protein n=1 Tax=Wuchereria bancrofti TaxID=6293 RepID=A0A3P7FQY1_WUCBA|nr:unnamed protein product [Wuchereria bancrofti]
MSTLPHAILIYFAIMIQSLKTHKELQNQNMWDRRKELRQLDEVTLSLLQYKFEHFRQESTNNVTLIDALAVAVMTNELIIESFCGMLNFISLSTSSEAAKVDKHVNDETNDSLLITQNVNSTEEETDRQLLKIEQRCKSGALLTFLRQTLPPDNREFLKISKSSASTIALIKGCSLCETNSSKRWLFCDRNIHRCVSKIIPNGDCTKIHSSLAPKAVLLTRSFTSDINSNHIPRTDVHNAENSAIFMKSSHWVISEGKYQILDFMPIESPKFKGSAENSSYSSYNKKEIILPEKQNRSRKKFKKHHGKFRNKGEVEINKISPKKYPESIRSIRTKNLSKYDHYHRKLKQQKAVSKMRKSIVHLYGFDRPSSSEELLKSLKIGPDFGKVPEFGMKDAKMPVPAEQHKTTAVSVPSQYVYFSITVIEDKSKRNNLLNRAVDVCDITLSKHALWFH